MNTSSAHGVIQLRPTYTSLFRRGRILGHLLARPGFNWETSPGEVAKGSNWMIHQSCNASFTPFIADVAQQALAVLGEDVPVIGGSESCCGELNFHFGDPDLGEIAARKAQQSFSIARARTVVSICPDCDAIFHAKPIPRRRYESANIASIIVENLPKLVPHMRPVAKRIVVHDHDDSELTRLDAANVMTILSHIPGLTILSSRYSRGVGRHCQALRPMPIDAQAMMFAEARELRADGLVVGYHSCYRQHLKMQLPYGVETFHFMGLVGEALGLNVYEEVKRLRLIDDVDEVTRQLLPKATGPDISFETLREIVAKAIFC